MRSCIVTEAQIRDYIGAFRESYALEAQRLPVENRHRLAYAVALNAEHHAMVTVSQSGGVGVRYKFGKRPDEVRFDERELHKAMFPLFDRRRGYETLVHVPNGGWSSFKHATIRGGLVRVDNGRVALANCLWENSPPFRITDPGARIVIHESQIDAGYSRDHIIAAHIFGSHDASSWTVSRAERDASGFILSAFGDLEVEYRRPQLDWFQSRVLILGDFSSVGRERLAEIQASLKLAGYSSFTAEDVPDMIAVRLNEKVSVLSSLCRFVVMDNSSMSGHLAEIEAMRRSERPALLLHAKDSRTSAMSRSIGGPGTLIIERDYDPSTLTSVIKESCEVVEERITELSNYLFSKESWRKGFLLDDKTTIGVQPWPLDHF